MGDERPDGWTSTRNFHICYARVRTMVRSHPDGWSRIGNFLNCWTRVRTKANRRPDGDIWIVILALCMSLSRRESTSLGRLKQSSLKLNLERIWSWSIIDRCPDRLLRCLDECKLEQKLLDTVKGPNEKLRRPNGWCLVWLGVRTVRHVVQTDGTVDKWASRRDGTIVRMADKEPNSSDW
jgi:hypothetical protein